MKTNLFIVILVLSIFSTLSFKNNDLLIDSPVYNLNQIPKRQTKQLSASNCLVLDTLEFEGKQPLMDYINRYRAYIENARNESQRSHPIDVIYEEDSLHYIFPLVDFWLKKNGFKPVSDEEFRSKVKEIYNLDILEPQTESEKDNNYYLFISKMYTDPYGPHLGYTYFVKGLNFIFRPTLDEYLAKITEDRQYYTCFKQTILHQNKFLFNDCDASLTWLINNDMEFLEMLITDFGYDKNDKINNAILNKICKKYFSYGQYKNIVFNNLFFKKDEDSGKLQIRKGLLKTVEEKTNSNNLLYFFGLNNYFFDFFHQTSKEMEKYNPTELSEIFVNIAVVEERMRSTYYEPLTNEWNTRSNTYYISKKYPKLLTIAKENNYFGMPFSDVLEMIQSDDESM